MSTYKVCLNDLGAGDLEIYFYPRALDFITFAGGARLPAFHTCVGANDQLLTEEWYKQHGMLRSMFIYALHVGNLHV
jgi:hypothetical protein